MKQTNESRLWQIVEKEKLVDFTRFHAPGLDEVPLFSRESDLKFLRRESGDPNQLLLKFALKFLSSVIAYEQHPEGYFAAVTLWDAPQGLFMPSLFVWSGNTSELKTQLKLAPVKSDHAKQIKRLVLQLKLGERFEVREDSLTVPGSTRVFISLASAPYRGFLRLSSLSAGSRATPRAR